MQQAEIREKYADVLRVYEEHIDEFDLFQKKRA
jgi:hypothetical protein